MDAEKEEVVTLKVLVDTKQNRVVFAEADKDFVDILFSFLTFPLGTIARLVHKQAQPSVIGCMHTLYAGLENLETKHFYSHEHKTMLLRPLNSSGHPCRMLKLNIDDTELAKYNNSDFSEEVYIINDNIVRGDNQGGVFVRGKAMLMISDDLKVCPMSTSASFELLSNLHDFNALEEKNLKVGLSEIPSLLRLSFLSKTPLTDMLLLKHVDRSGGSMIGPTGQSQPTYMENPVSNCKKMTLKVMLRKSNGKVLYAEAKQDFVNYLLSILIIPLGAVVKLLNSSPLGCINNLYKSVEELSVDSEMKREYVKDKLLSPKVAPQFGYKVQLLGMNEHFHPQGTCEVQSVSSQKKYKTGCFFDPWKAIGGNGFLEGPATFIVTDDLTVTALSSIANLFVLNKLNVPISDIEEHLVAPLTL